MRTETDNLEIKNNYTTIDNSVDQNRIDIENRIDIFAIQSLEKIPVDITDQCLHEDIKKKAKEIMIEMEGTGEKEKSFLVKTSLGEVLMFTITSTLGATGIVYTIVFSAVSPAVACMLIGAGISCIVVPFIFKGGTNFLNKIYQTLKTKLNAN